MAAPLKDVLLVGFGAVGTIYSHVLKKSGLARVTAVARSNYEAVNANGMHIKSVKYGDIPSFRPDRVVKSVIEAADRPYSYVVLTTKAVPELARTPTILAPLLESPYADAHPQPTYVLLQNGLGVERDLYDALKALQKNEPKIISTIVWIGTNLVEKNVVIHNHFDRVSLGMYRHGDHLTTTNSAEETAVLEDFGTMLDRGGTTLTIVPEIQRVKFAKNFWNIAFSSFSTLTGSPLTGIFRPPPSSGQSYEPYVAPVTAEYVQQYTIPTLHAILRELVAVGRAMGFPDSEDGLPSSLAESTIASTAKLHQDPDHKFLPSMLLDAQKGLPIEVEVIFGEVVRMAKERNVEVPRIETLYALLTVVQNQILGGFRTARA
ncbi:6-phosphogluconate dehydrogenase C-terminal domain-like protein [Leucogyrophana mollusca]|uniref:6-phosphogluconate dehydrogenase C-terminal domain-like protein n=1 Tax=Leucogyrophana mollusca TaxID=85980 RepID=A0ACB8B4P7_9AGAM|nr:6-phosphogluconate dehydrogenase C-terminal domain-like protein [Leucogyrophana mollusca]